MRIVWSHLNKIFPVTDGGGLGSSHRPATHRIGLLDFSATAREGITAVLGPQGSGKSTLLRMTAALLVPDDGRITYQMDNGDTVVWSKGRAAAVGTSALGSLKSRIVYTPPIRRPDKTISLEKYLLYLAQTRQVPHPKKRVAELIAEWGLAAVRRDPLTAIPGTMLKRFLLVESLLKDPLIWLLDDPTDGLDRWGKKLLWRELGRLAARRIVLIATHDLQWAERADHLLLMESGACRRLGPKKLLTASVPEGTVAAWYETMQTFSKVRPKRGTFIADQREKWY